MKLLFANGASALLAASIDDNDLTIQVATGFGALFPNPGADEGFLVALVNAAGDKEIVLVTSRSADLLTVPPGGRAQEGTSAQSWTNTLTRVEVRVTKGTLEKFIQRSGDAMEGDLDMSGNEIQDAELTGATVITGGQTVGTAIRGTLDDASNEIVVPNDGSRATAGGEAILTAGDTDEIRAAAFVVGQVIMWYGAAIDIPDGWALCDGTGGTPDLRNRFIVGAGDTYALNDTGGAVSGTTSSDGAHDHGGETGEEEAGIPAHTHRLYVWESGSNGPGQMENFGNSGIGPARGVAGNADSNTYAYRQATVDGHDLIEESAAVGDAAHSHTVASGGAHTHTVETLPPYKALFYIMFTG